MANSNVMIRALFLSTFQLIATEAAFAVVSELELKSERVVLTPDLMQSDPRAALPSAGSTSCGPVAASNALVYLAKKGYPKLLDREGIDSKEQAKLARRLALMMGVNAKRGASPSSLLKALSRYIESRGYPIEFLKYQGREQLSPEFSSRIQKPDLQQIKDSLTERSAVLLLIGWYRYSAKKDEYLSFAQHWVTVVGAGKIEEAGKRAEYLLIHDPAPRSGKLKNSDLVKCELLEHGYFSRYSMRRSSDVNGFYKLSEGLKIKKGADCGILDAAVIMRLK
ncbi:MAG: hypothetical protein K2X27_16470 [Candidatus Obscuribacterales bacterium]|nr:hypothetical protein [Candidatus Obscuribacterales bacterium]